MTHRDGHTRYARRVGIINIAMKNCLSNRAPIGAASRRQGTSLVEVMVACVILAVIAVGAGAYQIHSRSQITIQRDRRVAAEIANSRLESLRATSYSQVAALLPTPRTYNTYYLRRQGATWAVATSDPGEVVTNNNFTRAIITTAQFADVDGGSSTYDYLKLGVTVRYSANSAATVKMETFFGVDH